MVREDVIRELASLVRSDHWAAAFAVGWCVRDTSSEALEELVSALRGRPDQDTRRNHWTAYRERWEPRPDAVR